MLFPLALFRRSFFKTLLVLSQIMFAGTLLCVSEELKDIAEKFAARRPYNYSSVREKTRKFLEAEQKQGQAQPLKFDPSGYWQVDRYMMKQRFNREAQFYAVLQVLDFIERNQKHKNVARQRAALVALGELVGVIAWLPPPKSVKNRFSRSKEIPEWQKEEKEALRFLLEAGWLTPYFGSDLVENDETAALYFVQGFEAHIREARLRGIAYYPYACWQFERFIPKYLDNDIARARTYFWLSWMYLHLKEYDKAKIAAGKIPKIRGMEEAGTRLSNYAETEKKKSRKNRRR